MTAIHVQTTHAAVGPASTQTTLIRRVVLHRTGRAASLEQKPVVVDRTDHVSGQILALATVEVTIVDQMDVEVPVVHVLAGRHTVHPDRV